LTFKAKAASYFRTTRVTRAACDGNTILPLRTNRSTWKRCTKLLKSVQKAKVRAWKDRTENTKFSSEYCQEKHDGCTSEWLEAGQLSFRSFEDD